jgi:hypothetical protein
MTFVRVWLPVATAVVGLVLVIAGDEILRGAGIVLIGIAGLVALINALARLTLQSERDREREEAKRRYFDEHGHWPDERR